MRSCEREFIYVIEVLFMAFVGYTVFLQNRKSWLLNWPGGNSFQLSVESNPKWF